MPRFILKLGIPCVLAVVSLQAGGVIEGRVKLAPAGAGPAPSSRYQIKASGPIGASEPQKAVVYLEGDLSAVTNKPPVLQLAQKGFQFEQGLVPIQKGTVVEFPNLDDDYHNVFSYSKIKRFDLGRYKKDEKPASQKFDQPGVVKVYCEIHEHMRSTILVLDTPVFQKTDGEGKFKLENIPPGSYKIKAWLDEKTVLEQPVEVKDQQTVRVEFEKK